MAEGGEGPQPVVARLNEEEEVDVSDEMLVAATEALEIADDQQRKGGIADLLDANPHGIINIEDLSPEIQKKVRALKKNQLDILKEEANFYQAMHELEMKHLGEMKVHFAKRRSIIDGSYEPSEADCELVLGPNDPEAVVEAKNENGDVDGATQEVKEQEIGIPCFWRTIFRNVDTLALMTDEKDEAILNHLMDIDVEMTSAPMGFKLHFHFSPNEYFSNSVLTKSYEMECGLDPEDPFTYEGTQIVQTTGCKIDWMEGKNLTEKTVNKKQKHKVNGTVRNVQKVVKALSFFNFFDPPLVSKDELSRIDIDDEIAETLNADFQIAQYFRERIVPRAVLHFTGENLDDEDEDLSEEEEEDEEEEDLDSEEDGFSCGGIQVEHP